jgi:hypothetical protein
MATTITEIFADVRIRLRWGDEETRRRCVSRCLCAPHLPVSPANQKQTFWRAVDRAVEVLLVGQLYQPLCLHTVACVLSIYTIIVFVRTQPLRKDAMIRSCPPTLRAAPGSLWVMFPIFAAQLRQAVRISHFTKAKDYSSLPNAILIAILSRLASIRSVASCGKMATSSKCRQRPI